MSMFTNVMAYLDDNAQDEDNDFEDDENKKIGVTHCHLPTIQCGGYAIVPTKIGIT